MKDGHGDGAQILGAGEDGGESVVGEGVAWPWAGSRWCPWQRLGTS